MKLFKSIIAVLAVAPLFAAAAYAGGHLNCRSHPGGKWEIDPAEYVMRNCAFCHGPALEGKSVAPRLAGQHMDYIVMEITEFKKRTRNSTFSLNYMSHVSVNILPDNYCEVGAYISSMPAEPARDGKEELRAWGEEIFMRGNPGGNVPACQFCHGPEAQGLNKFPRLGGQSYTYLKRRLENWNEGYESIAAHMPGIAATLNSQEIDAVSSYLSFLEAAPSKGKY
jgi:cytochrome c553